MKIENKYFAFLGIISFVLLFAACKKSFLEADIRGGIPLDSYYKTDADAMAATTAAYRQLYMAYMWGAPYIMKEMLSGEVNKGGGGAGDWPTFKLIQTFTHDPQNSDVADAWNKFYGIISRANLVVNQVTPDNDLRKRMIAEAKTLRAFSYFELVTLWGGVPIILDIMPPSEWSTQTRATVAEVYAQIEKDLTEAIQELPEKSAYDELDKWRASKGAARGLLLKAYLYQEKWDNAVEQFVAIETSNEYGLEPDFGRIFRWQGELGNESVFEVMFANQGLVSGGWEANAYDCMNIMLMAPNQDYYTQAPGDSLLPGWGFDIPLPGIWQAFVDAGDAGVRRYATLWSEAELEAIGGRMDAACYDFEGFIRRKYGSYSYETTLTGGADWSGSFGTNMRLLRYADVLLMAAEAYYRKGDESNALKYLNMVRSRAQMPEISPSGSALFDAIVLERRLELAFEGFRFQDLVRWGLAAQELGPAGFQAGKSELLPIPFAERQIDPALEQNPGY
jgi:starch-binding outer membrane protein, SusD/RagB family